MRFTSGLQRKGILQEKFIPMHPSPCKCEGSKFAAIDMICAISALTSYFCNKHPLDRMLKQVLLNLKDKGTLKVLSSKN